jgi:cobalt/nickel transport system permease protein
MHPTLEAFSDRCAYGDNVLTRADARVKLALALAAIAAVLLSGRILLPLTLFAACVAASLVLRVPGRVLLWRVAGPLSIAAVMCLLRAFLSHGTPLGHFSLWHWQLTLTREGVAEGILIGSRVMGSVSVLILLGSVTPAYKVFGALRWARLPQSLVELAMLMYRHIFSLLGQLADVHSAQRVRLGYAGFRRSLSSAGNLMGMAILRSLDQADRMHEAMVARGYRGVLPIGLPGPIRLADVLALAAGLATLAACYLLCEGGPI